MPSVEAPRIRCAGPADAPALAETVRQGFESYRRWAPRGWEPPPVGLQLTGIRDRLAEAGTWCALAENGGVAAGHAALIPARARAAPYGALAGLGQLWMLFLREPWWGTGLAAELLGLATAEAAARGFRAIRLYTPAAHGRARAFYAREGWEPAGQPAYEPALGLDLVEYRRPLPGSMPPCPGSEPPTPVR
jgi:GNAT superfamily N-acetyltransferase